MRYARRILIAVVLGLITTVAVSWTLTIWRTLPTRTLPSRMRIFEFDGRAWQSSETQVTGAIAAGWGDLARTSGGTKGKVVGEILGDFRASVGERYRTQLSIPVEDSPSTWGTFAQSRPLPNEIDGGTDFAAGWPWPCLWWQMRASQNHVATLDGAISLPTRNGGQFLPKRHLLPWWPIWHIFAFELLMYSAIWFALLFAGPEIRRIHRRCRNRCEQCGYSLAGNTSGATGCPECGLGRTAD